MQLEKAIRTSTFLRLGITGASGSGRTLGALRTAFGLCGNWAKVAVIDTNYRAATLYSSEGAFNTVGLSYPFSPEQLLNALILCEEAQMEVIIIDTISDEWSGFGGTLDQYYLSKEDLAGKWSSIMNMHQEFLRALFESPTHIIVTLRKDKSGMIIQSDGFSDHLHVLLELKDFQAHVLKDKTSLFQDQDPHSLNALVGARLSHWCGRGTITVPKDLQERINGCASLQELFSLLFQEDIEDVELIHAFTRRRLELEGYCRFWNMLTHHSVLC
jgi:hypothetical protein